MRTTADRPDLEVRKVKLKVVKEIADKKMVTEAEVEKGKMKKANLEKESEVNQTTAEDTRDTNDPKEIEAAAAAAAIEVVLTEAVEADRGKQAAAEKREV